MPNELPFKDGKFIDDEENAIEIGRVSVRVECPEALGGVIRLVDVVVYDVNDCELFTDSKLINNDEFHSEDEIVAMLSGRYGIPPGLIEFD